MAHWTREQILDSIGDWLTAGGDGRQLSYREFRASLPDRERPRYPTPEAVNLHAGGWDAVMTTLGGPTRRRKWTPGSVIEAVRGWARERSGPPTATAYARASRDNVELPGVHVLARQIGGWRDVLAAVRIGELDGASAAGGASTPELGGADAAPAPPPAATGRDGVDPVALAEELAASQREVSRLAYRNGTWPEGADSWAQATVRFEDRLLDAARRLGVAVPPPRWPARRPRYDRTTRAAIEQQLRAAGLDL